MSQALRRAAGAALVAAALELSLARLTSGPQTRADVLTTLLGWIALAAGPVWIVGRVLAEGAPRRLLEALLSSLPALCISGGVLLTPFFEAPRQEHALGLAWIVAVLGVRAGASRVGPSTMSAPEAAAWVGLAALVGWFTEHGELPGLFVAGAFLSLCVVAGAVCTRWLHMPAAFLAAAVISFAPPLPLVVEWNEGPAQAPGPDIVLFTVAGLAAESMREGRAFEWLRENGAELAMPRVASPGALLSGHAHAGSEPLPASRTLAERLSLAGYDTAAIVASERLGAEQGFARGYAAWQHVSVRRRFALPRGPGERTARTILPRLLTRAGLRDRPAPNGARHVARWVKELLEQRRIDRPFHLWVHWSDPVPPYLQADQAGLPRSLAIAIERGELDTGDPEHREALTRAYANEVALVERGLRYAIESLGRVPQRGRVLAFASTEPLSAEGPGRLVLVGLAGELPASATELDLLPTLLDAASLGHAALAGRSVAALAPAAQ